MARPPTGNEALEAAKLEILNATTLKQLRIAQAVVLPLELRISLAQTAAMIGMTPGWVARTRVRYIAKHSGSHMLDSRGGRRNFLVTPDEEEKMVADAMKNRRNTWRKPPAKDLREKLTAKVGRKIALSTAYNILNRVLNDKPEWKSYQFWM
jgi:hypothetical protein